MAEEVAALNLRLEATLSRFETQLDRAQRKFNSSAGRMEQRAGRLNSRLENVGGRFGGRLETSFASIGRAAAKMATAVGGALAVNEIRRYADSWTEANNRLKATSQISGVQARSLSDLADAAIAARTPLETYVDLYSRIQRAAGTLGATEEQVARATQTVAESFKAGGASAEEVRASLTQLGQALGSGILAGDELRSIRENAPLVAQAVADEFNTTIGGLKKLGSEGKLTSDRVLKGILAGQDRVHAAFLTTNATVGDSFENLRTAVIRYVGETNQSVGASQALVAVLQTLAKNLDLVATGALILGSRALAPLVTALASKLATAAKSAATALEGLTVAEGAAAIGATAFSRALALLGGPVGAVIVGLTAAAAIFTQLDAGPRNAADAIDQFEGSVSHLKRSFEDLKSVEGAIAKDTESLKTANERLNEAMRAGGAAAIATANADVTAIQQRIKANVALRDAIIASVQAQQAALKAQATVAKQKLVQQFAPPGAFTKTTTTGEGTPFVFKRTVPLQGTELLDAQNKKLADLRDNLAAANKAGKMPDALAAFAALDARFQSADVAATELQGNIDKILAGIDTGTGNIHLPTGLGTGVGTGQKQKLDEFQKALRDLKERSLGAAATIKEVGNLSPIYDDYAISLESAATAQDVLNKAKRAGVAVDEQQIRNLAEGTVALEHQAQAAQQFGQAVTGIRDDTKSLERQKAALEGINPVFDKYGQAAETAQAEQELTNLAIKAGIPLTLELRDAIHNLAAGYGVASAALKKQQEEQQKFKAGVEDFQQTARATFTGFIDGALQGKKATDLLAEALDQLGQKLEQISLDAIFGTGSGRQGLSGFLAGFSKIFGIFGGVAGGGTGIGTGGGFTATSTPGLYAEGGPTAGRRGEVAGLVHGEEYVVKAGPAQKFRGILDAMNSGRTIPGFAEGGFVRTLRLPRLPATAPNLAAASANRAGAGMNITMNVYGVRDADSFRRSEPQLVSDLRRKLGAVARRGTA